MKSLFFICIGAIPLAALTVLAFGNILTVRGWRPEINATHFSDQMSLAKQTSEEMRTLRQAPVHIAANNLLCYPLPDGFIGMRQEVPLWGGTPKYLRAWSEIVGHFERYMESHRDWESQDISKLVQIKGEIREFSGALSDEREYQAKALKLLSRMDIDLDMSIEKIQKTKEAESILLEARNALDDEDWQTCASLSRRLQDDFELYTSSEVKVNIVMMINSCAFHLAESGVELALKTGDSDTRREELQKLINQVENPDQLSESERKTYEGWKTQFGAVGGGKTEESGSTRASGSTGVAADVSGGVSKVQISEQTKKILAPFYASSNAFPARVRAASLILKGNDTPLVRAALKEELMKLIRQGIPEKSSTGLTAEQGKMVDRYNKGRDHLLNHAADREVWAKFISFCTGLEEKAKASNGAVSFSSSIRAAQIISEPDLWPRVVEIIK